MTTETDCPSHIEARKRLADTLRLALERKPEGARTLSIHLPVDAAEALLATPTQGGVGREDITTIARGLLDRRAEDWSLKDAVAVVELVFDLARARTSILALLPAPKLGEGAEPIPMLLYCPKCGEQHIDEPDERTPGWTNPPHRSHLCHKCGCIWRPADVATTGVRQIETLGKADTWAPIYPCAAIAAPGAPEGWRDARFRLSEACRPHKFELYDDDHDPSTMTVTVKRDDVRLLLAALKDNGHA